MPSVLMNSPQSSCLRASVVPSRQSSPTGHAETNGDKFLLPCLPTALRSNPAVRRAQKAGVFSVALTSLQSYAI